VVEFNLVVTEMPAAFLTAVVVSAGNSQHNVTWDGPCNPAFFLRLREWFVDEEHRTYVSKNCTSPFNYLLRNGLGILPRVKMPDFIFKVRLSPSLVFALS